MAEVLEIYRGATGTFYGTLTDGETGAAIENASEVTASLYGPVGGESAPLVGEKTLVGGGVENVAGVNGIYRAKFLIPASSVEGAYAVVFRAVNVGGDVGIGTAEFEVVRPV